MIGITENNEHLLFVLLFDCDGETIKVSYLMDDEEFNTGKKLHPEDEEDDVSEVLVEILDYINFDDEAKGIESDIETFLFEENKRLSDLLLQEYGELLPGVKKAWNLFGENVELHFEGGMCLDVNIYTLLSSLLDGKSKKVKLQDKIPKECLAKMTTKLHEMKRIYVDEFNEMLTTLRPNVKKEIKRMMKKYGWENFYLKDIEFTAKKSIDNFKTEKFACISTFCIGNRHIKVVNVLNGFRDEWWGVEKNDYVKTFNSLASLNHSSEEDYLVNVLNSDDFRYSYESLYYKLKGIGEFYSRFKGAEFLDKYKSYLSDIHEIILYPVDSVKVTLKNGIQLVVSQKS